MEPRLVMSNDTNNSDNNDRFEQKLRFYDGLNVSALPKNLSKANSALIWVNALSIIGLCGLAKYSAPWYGYVIITFLGTQASLLAIWREKDVQRNTNSSIKDSS
jgi:hypothetical protein